jgi:hypothetical protein
MIRLVIRGVKNFRVNTAFKDTLTAADVGTLLVDFLAVCEVSKGPSTLLVLVLQPIHTTSKYTDPHAPKPGEQLK